jgi:hypothetical protein
MQIIIIIIIIVAIIIIISLSLLSTLACRLSDFACVGCKVEHEHNKHHKANTFELALVRRQRELGQENAGRARHLDEVGHPHHGVSAEDCQC